MVPARLGGIGAGFAEYARVAFELARGNGATALVFNMHASVTGALAGVPGRDGAGARRPRFVLRRARPRARRGGGRAVVRGGDERARRRLAAVATVHVVHARCRTAGRSRASKTFCSGAGNSDAYLVAARSTADPSLVSQFLVPADAPGPDGRAHLERAGHAGDSLARPAHRRHRAAGRPGGRGRGPGRARRAVDAALDGRELRGRLRGRRAGRRSTRPSSTSRARKLGGLASVRSRIGRADAAVAAARLVVDEAARRVDEAPGDEETNRWVWRAKLLAGTTAADVAASLLEAAGTSATRRGHPLERLFRDARCGSLQPATSDVCADWLGVAALGGDPENDGSAPRW